MPPAADGLPCCRSPCTQRSSRVQVKSRITWTTVPGKFRGEERGAVSAGSEELGGRAREAREAHVGRARTEMRAISGAEQIDEGHEELAGRAVVTDDERALI